MAYEQGFLIKKHLSLLGFPVRDRVTGFSGVVASVTFDLYGCIQGIVNPGLGADGKLGEQCWFDISRLEITGERVMDPPNYEYDSTQAQGKQGAAEKPAKPTSN